MQQQARVYIFFGLIATGKSTLAKAWAQRHGLAHYNSDVVRKELAGLSPTAGREEAVDQGIYSKEFSQKTYEALLARAEAKLLQGEGVILDASYQSREERDKVRALARRLRAPVVFVLCECSDAVKKKRLDIRAQDPAAVSDGRWEIYLRQRERFEDPAELVSGELISLDTDRPLSAALDHLEILLQKELP